MLARHLALSCVLLAAGSGFAAAQQPVPPGTTAAPVPAKPSAATTGLRIATFDIDVTPPVGAPLAYDPVANKWDLGLRARGIVLLGAGRPIVLCAFDWIGISNEAYDAYRDALARAAGTSPDRVAVHVLHQHDAPDADFTTERILQTIGREPGQYAGRFPRSILLELETAVHDSLAHARPITQLGLGEARVEKVASNRRILGPDGKVRATRWTTSTVPELRAEPEGTIDPVVSLVSFWSGEQPVAVLSYYATHPQSYYRTGIPNPDFPGVARFLRQMAVPAALAIHFNGAGGNIGAGKYNDGAKENRLILAQRLTDGMRRAWETTQRQPIGPSDVGWTTEAVLLPPAKHLKRDEMEALLRDRDAKFLEKSGAAKLAWLRRNQQGNRISISCLKLGRARVLHLPGELFVEYQLAAKAARPDLFVAMAAYGDLGPGYIGTRIAYDQGGYETSPDSSNVAPEVEGVLMGAIRKLLQAKR